MNVNVGTKERWASALGGGALLSLAARRRSPLAIPLALGAAVLVWRGVTGSCPVNAAMGRDTAEGADGEDRPGDQGFGPAPVGSTRGGEADPALAGDLHRTEDKDEVQRASEESFPASDPPSFSPGVAG